MIETRWAMESLRADRRFVRSMRSAKRTESTARLFHRDLELFPVSGHAEIRPRDIPDGHAHRDGEEGHVRIRSGGASTSAATATTATTSLERPGEAGERASAGGPLLTAR
jgi:hypothetical protein